MKRLAALLLAAALCCSLLCGCSKDAVSFVYYTADTITTLDPQLASTPAELTAVKNMFAGLYRLDENGRAVADRAAKTEVSADGLVYTFTLASGDAFDDGDKVHIPVTAADYVFALRRALDPATGCPTARSFLAIAGAAEVLAGTADPSTLGVQALSDSELRITLAAADDGLAVKLAGAAAMPCNETFFDSTNGAYGLSLAAILGNGAFQPTAWSTDKGLTLRRLTNNSGALVDRIRLVPEDGERTAADRLSAGLQDGALVAGGSSALDDAGYPAQTFETTVWMLVFNCENPSLANLSVRQALAAVARLSANDLSGQAALSAADGLVPGGALLTDGSSYRSAAKDVLPVLAAAQSYPLYRVGLSELGVDKLSGLKVLVPADAPWDTLYPLINQRWQRGLSAFFSVETLTADELAKRVAKGDFDMAVLPVTMTASDPGSLLSAFLSSDSGNLARYRSAAYDELVTRALAVTTAAGQADAWRSAEQQLLSDAAVVPLAFQKNSFYLSPKLTGIVVSPFGPVLDLSAAEKK